MNVLGSLEQNWFNVPNREAFFSSREENEHLLAHQLYLQLEAHPAKCLPQEGAELSVQPAKEAFQCWLIPTLAKGLLVKARREYVEEWFCTQVQCWWKSGIPYLVCSSFLMRIMKTKEDEERSQRWEEKKYLKVSSDSSASQRWRDVMCKARYWLLKELLQW